MKTKCASLHYHIYVQEIETHIFLFWRRENIKKQSVRDEKNNTHSLKLHMPESMSDILQKQPLKKELTFSEHKV